MCGVRLEKEDDECPNRVKWQPALRSAWCHATAVLRAAASQRAARAGAHSAAIQRVRAKCVKVRCGSARRGVAW